MNMPSKSDKYAALAASFTPLSEVVAHANVMLYGPAGSGKTVELLKLAQAVTPADQEILFLDSAQGFVSARNHPGIQKRVRRLQFQGISQIATLYEAISERADGFERVGCVIIDEISSIAKEDLSTIVSARVQAGKLTQYEGADWPGYNANLERVGRELRKLFKLDVHIMLASHMKESEVKSTGLNLKRPSMPPEMAEVGNGLVHVVAHMSAATKDKGGKVEYVHTIQVHPTTLVFAKSRVGGLAVKVSPDVFNKRMAEFVQDGIETEVESETVIDTDDSFAGIEVQE